MKYLVAIAFLGSLAACQQVKHNKAGKQAENADKLKQINWMLGKWEMHTPDGIITEQWAQSADDRLDGVSYMITQTGDTPFRESIHVDYKNDSLFYNPTVSNQNSGQEVKFSEKSLEDNVVVFENLAHDFPQRIIYKRTSDSTIVASIEGMKDGQMKREEFAYVRSGN